MEDEDLTKTGEPQATQSRQPLEGGASSDTFKGFGLEDPAKPEPAPSEQANKRSAGDSLVNALVIVGLTVAAVALWEVAVVAAVAVAVVAVTVAILESQEDTGNIFDHKANMVTAVGLGTAALLFGTGNISLGLATTGLSLLPQLDRIFNFLTGFNLSKTTWWIILLIIAVILYAVKNGKFKDQMAPQYKNTQN